MTPCMCNPIQTGVGSMMSGAYKQASLANQGAQVDKSDKQVGELIQ